MEGDRGLRQETEKSRGFRRQRSSDPKGLSRCSEGRLSELRLTQGSPCLRETSQTPSVRPSDPLRNHRPSRGRSFRFRSGTVFDVLGTPSSLETQCSSLESWTLYRGALPPPHHTLFETLPLSTQTYGRGGGQTTS